MGKFLFHFVFFLLALLILYVISSVVLFCYKTGSYSYDSSCYDIILFQRLMPFILFNILRVPQILDCIGVSEYISALRWGTITDGVNFTQFFLFHDTFDVLVAKELIDGVYVYTYTPIHISHVQIHPVMLYFHGGGSVLSSAANFDFACRYMANDIGIIIIQVCISVLQINWNNSSVCAIVRLARCLLSLS